tara:strand:+ start:1264 stop:1398 length:135 start_codon:yes stop_codon:yes gene_type:complete
MIKEITIDGEQIIIDFSGAPFWKLIVIQLFALIFYRKTFHDTTL